MLNCAHSVQRVYRELTSPAGHRCAAHAPFGMPTLASTPTPTALLQDGPCAFVFQNPDHQMVMPTVAAEVALGTGAAPLPRDKLHEIVEQCLRRVRLWDLAEASTATLSGGQKQRLAIAAALAQGPPAPKVRALFDPLAPVTSTA